MKRRFRLNRSTEFKRVRRLGRSYAHPLVVFIILKHSENDLRIGVSAGKSVGNAVVRNRAKRRMRAAVSAILPQLKTGYRVIAIARAPIHKATYEEITEAVTSLARRAHLLSEHKEVL